MTKIGAGSCGKICDKIENETKCRESIIASLLVVMMIGFICWLSLA